jgi:hypothetical protein
LMCLFNFGSSYRDKRVVGVFVRFRAPCLHGSEPTVPRRPQHHQVGLGLRQEARRLSWKRHSLPEPAVVQSVADHRDMVPRLQVAQNAASLSCGAAHLSCPLPGSERPIPANPPDNR